MSFPDLPPELVLQIATTLDDTRDISALMRVSSDLYRWLKRPLYRHNVDYENSSGIIRAVRGGNLSATCSFLMSARLDMHTRDDAGQTVLHIAARQPHGHSIMMILLRDSRIDINAVDSQGRTPLSYSASHHDLSPLTMLLQHQNIDINVADSCGQTALFHAAKAGNEKAAKLLLMRPDIEANALDENYLTPLWYAAAQGHVDVVNELLQCPIINFRPQNEYQSPLIAAVNKGHHRIFEILLESGKLDHHTRDGDGQCALWWAVHRKNLTAIRLLIKADADATSGDSSGITPLALAVAQGDEDIVRMLLEVTEQHRELCLAASTGRANIVKLLLYHGADINEEDDCGRTPLDRAKKAGHIDVEEALMNHRPL